MLGRKDSTDYVVKRLLDNVLKGKRKEEHMRETCRKQESGTEGKRLFPLSLYLFKYDLFIFV